MVQSDRPAANGFVSFMRKIYNPIGFSKGYNAILWFIFDGALFGFVLARLQYFDFWGVFCNLDNPNSTTPGDCFWFTSFDRNRIGIIIHLASILPAALLAVFQFVPVIRHKVLLYHRMAGYVSILLVLISNGSALAIANHSFGGDVVTRVFIGLLALITTTSLALAIYNIKRLQIEQHRAWMLRAWFYLATIISIRILMILMAAVSSAWGGEAQQYQVLPCDELLYINRGSTTDTYAQYPVCDPSNPVAFRPDGMAVVAAKFGQAGMTASTAQAALGSNFGTAGALALFLHAVGVEVYLRLTPREAERLRKVSYERQLERGFENPGSAGLTVERFGDADPWMPDGGRMPSEVKTLAQSPESMERKREVSPMSDPAGS